jgi:hypothetical protein
MQSKTLPHSDVVYLIGSFGASCLNLRRDSKPSSTTPKLSWRPCHFGNRRVTAICSRYHVVNSVLIRFNFYCFNAIDKTLHPPELLLDRCNRLRRNKNMGYWYVITPVLSGVLILLIVALIFNNMTSDRYYQVTQIP